MLREEPDAPQARQHAPDQKGVAEDPHGVLLADAASEAEGGALDGRHRGLRPTELDLGRAAAARQVEEEFERVAAENAVN